MRNIKYENIGKHEYIGNLILWIYRKILEISKDILTKISMDILTKI